LFEVTAGYIAKLRLQRSEGHFFDLPFKPEEVKAKWEEVCSFDRNNDYPTSSQDTFTRLQANLDRIEENAEKAKPKL
jgi:3-hydroxyacyl-CoA dehydrogenase/3a,7a,12a-trihydroxy-5b-cholest-24-enoyl-CoA hydratase